MSDAAEDGAWDPVWEETFRRRSWGRYPPEHLIRFVARWFFGVEDRSRVRLLEIGCGPGANVWFTAREGFSVSGIDGSPTAIRQAEHRLAGEGLKADLRVGDLTRLPWQNESFDGVIENASLYSNRMAAIKQALDEVHRVLRPGGPFLSSFFSDRSWGYGTGEMVEPEGFIKLREGPLALGNFCFFLKRDRIPELFYRFDELEVERISRTLNGERHLIEQLVITCRKPRQAAENIEQNANSGRRDTHCGES
jgi:SAM-dependent methyltransferase